MENQTQLAAIMFTDIVGYTRLMGTSEAKALEVLQQNRAVQKPLITKFNGRFIKELGDGTMASFSKASDAVRCAMAMQQAAQDHPDLNLRIGIHMGEVLFEDGDVFGDTVNIAARIESAGKAGAVFISGAVYGAVHNKTDVETQFIEQMQLKNVNRPIDVYEVAVEGNFQSKPVPKADTSKRRAKNLKQVLIVFAVLIVASAVLWHTLGESLFQPKLEQASIAVLPFSNRSSDPDHEIFCDGVASDIGTQLRKLKNLQVISETSSRHFKNSDLTIPEIAERLGVEYIVEGIVQRQGDEAYITANLINAKTDRTVWSADYIRKFKDAMSLQREMAKAIAKSLNINVSASESKELNRSQTNNAEALLLCLKGREVANSRTEQGLREGISLLEDAISLDPLYVDAIAQQVYLIEMLAQYNFAPRDSCIEIGEQLVKDAMNTDSLNALAHVAIAEVYFQRHLRGEKTLDNFVKAAERAALLGPNVAETRFMLARAYDTKKNRIEALKEYRAAEKIDPYYMKIKVNLCWVLIGLERYQEALDYIEENYTLLDIGTDRIRLTRDAYYGLFDWNRGLEMEYELISNLEGTRLEKYKEQLVVQAVWRSYLLYGEAEKMYHKLDSIEQLVPGKVSLWWLIKAAAVTNRLGTLETYMKSNIFMETRSEKQQVLELGWLYYDMGEFEKAVEQFERFPKDTRTIIAYSKAKMGDLDNALKLTQENKDDYYNNACLHALVNNIDNALSQIEKVDNWQSLAWSRIDNDLEPLWTEPRYQAKVASYNFPPLARDNVFTK